MAKFKLGAILTAFGLVLFGLGNVSAAGQLPMSMTDVNVSVGQNAVVNLYPPSGLHVNVVSISNAYVAYANIGPDNVMVVYGLATGNSQIRACTSDNYCGNVNVNVSGTVQQSQPMFFTTQSLPEPSVGQFYSAQLGLAGGYGPFSFSLASGGLPAGLSLASNGIISGTPRNSSLANFTVRASDNYGQTAFSNLLSLQPRGQVSGSSVYGNGTLINDAGTVYITYKNTKKGFTSMDVFTQLGYKMANVIKASSAGHANSSAVNSSNAPHPVGSWVSAGATIYFVHDQGLIPISAYSTFTGNGGAAKLVVPANSYDLNLPKLSVMIINDLRLKP